MCYDYSYIRNMYIYQKKDWPKWKWDESTVNAELLKVVAKQGHLLGRLSVLGFDSKEKTALETGVLDVLKNSEIEGEKLVESQVRSSIAKNLGLNYDEDELLKVSDTEGAVNMFIDSTRQYNKPITPERLFDWHAALFPTGRSAGRKIEVANWRTSKEPMQIVSGAMGKEQVHYEAPASKEVAKMMKELIVYLNKRTAEHPFIKAAIAHLWFEVIHPFEDGNGRIGRALVDKILCEADASDLRFYSFSNAVLNNRKAYYNELNKASKGDLNISTWIVWFLDILCKSVEHSESIIHSADYKRRFWQRFSEELLNERQLKVIKKLLDGFDGNITSSKWTRMCKCTKMTATRDINGLMEKDILIKNEWGGRSTSYGLNDSF